MRCGAGDMAAQVSARTPRPAVPANQGSIFFTPGCAVSALARSTIVPPLRLADMPPLPCAGIVAGTRSLIYQIPIRMVSWYADNSLLRTWRVASKATPASWRASMTLAMSVVSPRS